MLISIGKIHAKIQTINLQENFMSFFGIRLFTGSSKVISPVTEAPKAEQKPALTLFTGEVVQSKNRSIDELMNEALANNQIGLVLFYQENLLGKFTDVQSLVDHLSSLNDPSRRKLDDGFLILNIVKHKDAYDEGRNNIPKEILEIAQEKYESGMDYAASLNLESQSNVKRVLINNNRSAA